MNKSLYLMVRGETESIDYSLSRESNKNDLLFTIEDPLVVEVENGTLSALKKGTSTVDVSSSSDPEVSGSFIVKVGDEVRIEDLDLSKPVCIMYSRYGSNDSNYDQDYQIPYDKMTHFVLNLGRVLTNGHLMELEEQYASFANQVVADANENNVKVILALNGDGGDLGDKTIPIVINNENKRAILITDTMELIENYHLDGVGFNWEFPETEESKANLLKFYKELRAEVDNHARDLIVFNVVNSIYGNDYFHDDIVNYIDFQLIMVYHYLKDIRTDYSIDRGYQFLLESIDYWNTRSLPKEKAVYSVPFYGEFFLYEKDNMENESDWISRDSVRYLDIQEMYDNTTLNNDAAGNVSSGTYITDYALENNLNQDDLLGFYYWNGPDLIKRKATYLKDNNFRGLFIWALYFDTFDNTLLNAAYEGLY